MHTSTYLRRTYNGFLFLLEKAWFFCPNKGARITWFISGKLSIILSFIFSSVEKCGQAKEQQLVFKPLKLISLFRSKWKRWVVSSSFWLTQRKRSAVAAAVIHPKVDHLVLLLLLLRTAIILWRTSLKLVRSSSMHARWTLWQQDDTTLFYVLPPFINEQWGLEHIPCLPCALWRKSQLHERAHTLVYATTFCMHIVHSMHTQS